MKERTGGSTGVLQGRARMPSIDCEVVRVLVIDQVAGQHMQRLPRCFPRHRPHHRHRVDERVDERVDGGSLPQGCAAAPADNGACRPRSPPIRPPGSNMCSKSTGFSSPLREGSAAPGRIGRLAWFRQLRHDDGQPLRQLHRPSQSRPGDRRARVRRRGRAARVRPGAGTRAGRTGPPRPSSTTVGTSGHVGSGQGSSKGSRRLHRTPRARGASARTSGGASWKNSSCQVPSAWCPVAVHHCAAGLTGPRDHRVEQHERPHRTPNADQRPDESAHRLRHDHDVAERRRRREHRLDVGVEPGAVVVRGQVDRDGGETATGQFRHEPVPVPGFTAGAGHEHEGGIHA